MKSIIATFGFAVLSLLSSGVGTSLSPLSHSGIAYAAPAADEPKELTKEQTAFLELVEETDASLKEVIVTEHNTYIPAVSKPHEVLDLMTKLNAEWLKVSRQDPQFRPKEVRELVELAIFRLFLGRGRSGKDAADGWYLSNRKGETGLTELEKIIKMNLLDEYGKKEVLLVLSSHDFSNEDNKASVGFPPNFTIGTDVERNQVIDYVRAAKATAPYKELDIKLSKFPTLDQMIKASKEKKTGAEEKVLQAFLAGVKNNLYDIAVKKLNNPSPDKIKVEYFGREREAFEIKKALLKIEKGHVLMLGKPGVGKTTILKILSTAWSSGDQNFRDEAAPIILELKLSTLTHPMDMTGAETAVAGARILSRLLKRRIVLYVDEAHVVSDINRQAFKDHLAEMVLPGQENVQFIFSTTSEEGAVFVKDAAWSRRLTEVQVPEFSREDTEALINKTFMPLWARVHKEGKLEFDGVSPEAMDIAFAQGHIEQPYAGNPVATKELLEATIIDRLQAGVIAHETGKFKIEAKDVSAYLKRKKGLKLVPGDPEFDKIWEGIVSDFNDLYGGNDYYKRQLFPRLKLHFQTANRTMMTSLIQFGAPASGKSYGAEMMAKVLYNNEPLTINCGEYKNGGLELNKLIGSPRGTVGSTDAGAGAILTKYIRENPQGGIILFEETDYCHKDIMDFLTNTISDMAYTDGLGVRHSTDRFIVIQNTNQGQALMLPRGTENAMTWEQYGTRRKNVLRKVTEGDKTFEEVRPNVLKKVYEIYMNALLAQSASHDGNRKQMDATQELAKQMRRNTPLYLLPPNLDDLKAAARSWISRQKRDFKTLYGVTLDIDPAEAEKIVDFEKYQFEQGYSYVETQMSEKLGTILIDFAHNRGQTIKVTTAGNKVILKVGDQAPREFEPKQLVVENENPWGANPEMMNRINSFATSMSEDLSGNVKQIQATKKLLKEKARNWNKQVVITQIGTTGNGKTEFFKVMARKLFGSQDALWTIEGISHEWDLSNHFRPPTGVMGSQDETPFERWFESRSQAGGGIILFDELLSFYGLDRGQISNKVGALNKLYAFLDTGMLQLGNRTVDARSFIVGITGNSLQEFFDQVPDDPAADVMVDKILKHLGPAAVSGYLKERGIEPAKQARLGLIFVSGPLRASEALEAGRKMVRKAFEEVRMITAHNFEVEVDNSIVEEILKRLTTVKLGMREVNNKGFGPLITQPMTSILTDLPETKKVEVKLEDGKMVWYADGKPVYFQGRRLREDSDLKEEEWKLGRLEADANAKLKEKNTRVGELTDGTPQLADAKLDKTPPYSEQSLRVVTAHEIYGHWMVHVLLQKKNMDDAISLIPGEGHGGYVLPRDAEYLEFPTLTSILEQGIMLMAGHRAVVLSEGVSATGGGTHRRDEKQAPSDDLGRVYQEFDKIINNHLILSLSEMTTSGIRQKVKQKLERVLTFATDNLIKRGIDSKKFEPVFQIGLQRRFILGKELDLFVEQLDLKEFGKDEKLLGYEALVDGVEKAVHGGFLSVEDFPWVDDMMEALFIEYGARKDVSSAVVKELNDQWLKLRMNKKQWQVSCNSLLDPKASKETSADSEANEEQSGK